MKIGFSALTLDHGKSGIYTYVKELLSSLQALDPQDVFDVWICPEEASLLQFSSSHFRKKTTLSWTKHPLLNIGWHHLSLPWISYCEGYDVVHIPTIRRIPYIKPRCRLIATVHDVVPFKMRDKYDAWRMFYHTEWLKRCVPRCDHIITVSETTKQDLIAYLQYPEEKITVIYPGIDQTVFKPLDKSLAAQAIEERYEITNPFFVYVSRLEYPAKNHLQLIKAFELFKQRHASSHQLVLIGADWTDARKIHERVAMSPVREAIRLLGFIPEGDVALFYNGCDVMVNPSIAEGLGLPIIEALACQARVICSDIPVFREIGEGAVGMFDPQSVDSVYEAMKKGVEQKNHPVEGKKKALFDWKRAASQTLSLYRASL